MDRGVRDRTVAHGAEAAREDEGGREGGAVVSEDARGGGEADGEGDDARAGAASGERGEIDAVVGGVVVFPRHNQAHHVRGETLVVVSVHRLDENRRTKREAVGERERAHGREEGSRARVRVEDGVMMMFLSAARVLINRILRSVYSSPLLKARNDSIAMDVVSDFSPALRTSSSSSSVLGNDHIESIFFAAGGEFLSPFDQSRLKNDPIYMYIQQ